MELSLGNMFVFHKNRQAIWDYFYNVRKTDKLEDLNLSNNMVCHLYIVGIIPGMIKEHQTHKYPSFAFKLQTIMMCLCDLLGSSQQCSVHVYIVGIIPTILLGLSQECSVCVWIVGIVPKMLLIKTHRFQKPSKVF